MKAKEAKGILGVTQKTLNNYTNKGILRHVAVNPYHYEYNNEDVYRLVGGSTKLDKRCSITYSRVSLSKQKNDLKSQTQRLYDFCFSRGIIIDRQYEDIKSGMDFSNRKCFNKLLEEVLGKKIDKIVIENKDRLCRFGFELFQEFCKSNGTEIIVASESENKTYEQELTKDLVSIIHHFSMKSYSNRRKLNKIKKELMQK